MNNENELFERIRSPDPAIQLSALEEAAFLSERLAAEAVEALLRGTVLRGLVAERIAEFGCVTRLLEGLLNRPDSNIEARAHAATLLLHFGSRSGVGVLLEMLRNGRGPLIHIVMWMGKARIDESYDLIIELLRKWNLREDVYTGLTILESLKNFGRALPPDIVAKIQRETDEPFRKAIIDDIAKLGVTG